MRLIRGLHNIKDSVRGCVLTIGNFDGLHLGHQALLKQVAESAKKLDCDSCLMTFDPLPHEFFNKANPDARLMNSREKLFALQSLPVELQPDNFLILRFNQALANMPAEDFIQKILVDALAIKVLVVGDDFKFGKNRTGDLELLQKAGKAHDFEVLDSSTFIHEDSRVSSTRIRQALQQGDFKSAEKMMGRPFTLCGRINHGDKRGRTIGFPTANIKLHRLRTPIYGVYSVTMHSEELGDISGVANIGKRPTVNGEQFQLEVHLFDFNKEIYGFKVCVSFRDKIRDEMKFESFEALKEQISKDCETARNLLTAKDGVNAGNRQERFQQSDN